MRIHRAVALSVGFVFVLIGLTGSLNVFQPELDAWLNPDLTVQEATGERRSLNELVAAVQSAHPRRFGAWTLVMPRNAHDMVTAWFDKPLETAGEFYAPLMVTVNPYTAQVVASRFWGSTLTTWVLELHEELFMGAFGRKLLGGIALLLMGSLITGLLLWWPGHRGIGESLKLRLDRSGSRLAFDLHRLLGVYGSAVLLTVALTGFHFAYPGVLGALLGSSVSMADLHGGLNVKSTAVPNVRPVSAEESLMLARGLYPRSTLVRIQTPENASGSYQVWFAPPGASASDDATAVVCVDQYSGHILHVENLNARPAGEVLLSQLRALHTGAAFGLPGRILWSVAGLVPLILFVTGVSRWRRRRAVSAPSALAD